MPGAQAGPAGACRHKAIPEAVLKQVQRCHGEELRKGSVCPAPTREHGAQGAVWLGPEYKGTSLHPYSPRMAQASRAGMVSLILPVWVCGVEQQAQTSGLLRCLSVPRSLYL